MQTRRIVAIVMNELTDYSFELCAGSQALLSAHGYQPMIITGKHLDDPTAKANNLIYQALHSTQFAGALIHTFTLENSSSPTRLPQFLATLGDLPIVSIGAKLADYASITVEQSSGMLQLMDHLLARKRYQRYLFVRGLPTNADSLVRENIFRNYLEQQGLLAQAEFITGNFDGDVVYKEVYTRCQTELQRARQEQTSFTPTVVVCANDRMAVAAIEAVQAAGLRVPENVAVTGFDNSRECENSQIPLTTVAQPLRSMGEQAAEMLLDRLAGKIVADRTVPTQFIIRASCGDNSTPAPHASTVPLANCLDMPPEPTVKTAMAHESPECGRRL